MTSPFVPGHALDWFLKMQVGILSKIEMCYVLLEKKKLVTCSNGIFFFF